MTTNRFTEPTPTQGPGPSHSPPDTMYAPSHSMAKGLGWFSIALGMAELFAPRAMAQMTGVCCEGLLQAYGAREIACAGQKAQIVVNEPPVLPFRQPLSHGANGRAKAAGKIDRGDRGALGGPCGDRIQHGRIARAPVIRLAQREPSGRKAHTTPSIAAENSFADSAQVGRCSAAARAPAASRARSIGLSIK